MATRIGKIWMACEHLKRARDLLREALCKPAADTVAKALKSPQGALRHAYESEKLAVAARAAMAAPVKSPDDDPFFNPPMFAKSEPWPFDLPRAAAVPFSPLYHGLSRQ